MAKLRSNLSKPTALMLAAAVAGAPSAALSGGEQKGDCHTIKDLVVKIRNAKLTSFDGLPTKKEPKVVVEDIGEGVRLLILCVEVPHLSDGVRTFHPQAMMLGTVEEFGDEERSLNWEEIISNGECRDASICE